VAFIVVKKGDTEDEGKIFPLNNASTFIGRRTLQFTPDIELNSEVVSRRHVEIIQRDNRFMLRDLGSTNGTMLDDDRILPGKLYELKHNSKIGLGVEGDSSHIILQFKETEGTNIIDRKKSTPKVQVAWLKIDEAKKEIWVDGRQVKLSKKEYDLLLYLGKNAGKICSRDEIIAAVWPESKDMSAISDATVDQLIHRLREKVEPQPSQPARIVIKKSFGYMLV
jgi:pSer/pThr/pTyr-binding forkhead associated (FHA) protein